MKDFIVFCYARTGSYRLMDILNRQEKVVAYGEVYKKQWIEVDQDVLSNLGYERSDVEKRDSKPIKFYNDLSRMHEDKQFGFKIFPDHNYKILKHLAKDKGLTKIFLVRNPVQTYISEKVAHHTNKWVVREGEQPTNLDDVKVRFSFEEFSRHLSYRLSWYVEINSLAGLSDEQINTIDYLDALDSDYLQSFLNKIGIQCQDIETSHKKAISKSYDDIVENWDEVLRYFDNYKLNHEMRFLDFCHQFFLNNRR